VTLRLQLEGATQFLIAAFVLWVGLAVSNTYPLNIPVGRDVRWVALAQLTLFAVLYAVSGRRIRVPALYGVGVAFVALALLSAAWSPDARLTAGRAVTLAALFAAVGAIAWGAASGSDGIRPFLLAVLAGAVALAIGGLIVLAVSYDKAVVPATVSQGERYTGLGSNPDTYAMLFALAVPLSLWALWDARTRVQRVVAAAMFLLFSGSLAASGGRAMVAGAFVGTLVFLFLVPLRGRARVVLLAAAVGLFVVEGVASALPPRAARNPPSLYQNFGHVPTYGPHDAEALLPLEDEIGFPRPGHSAKRMLFDLGGRFPAWKGALRQGVQRPVVGYGFGTEERVFVDRFYPFYGDRPENSYIGTFLQLGVAGIVLLVVLIALALRAGLRLHARRDPAVAACLAVVVAGAVIAIGQSYITSVGSPATAPFWLCAFLLVAVPRRSASANSASTTSARK
jgi:hypothetical protein